MGELLSYSMVSGLIMLALYLCYHALLARANQHGFNRAILLLIYFVSFVASPLVLWALGSIGTSAGLPRVFSGMETADSSQPTESPALWGSVLIWIYLVGMIVVGSKTALTWLRLVRVVCAGEKHARNGYTLVVSDDERYAPFSWMRYVVISRADFEGDFSAIVEHELKHIACRHRMDLLVAQIVCIVNWFNPASWLMRDELMLVHEYQADRAVIESGHDPHAYQLLLIRKAAGARFPSLANSLSHSKLKRRITMMYSPKSSARRRLRALALLPVLLLVPAVTSIPAVHAAVLSISNSRMSLSPDQHSRPAKVMEVKAVERDPHASYDDMNFYLDGKKISNSVLKRIDPTRIKDITIDKKNNAIRIRTKNS